MAAPRDDPDVPASAGVTGRLHVALGRFALSVRARFKARVSLGVRLLALNDRGEVLLVRQSYMPGLALPGGAVDLGETARDAAMREAIEESGVELAAPPELFHLYFNPRLENRDHVALFVARGARQPRKTGPRAEILWSGFVAADDLPEDVTPATRRRIAEVTGGAPLSDIW